MRPTVLLLLATVIALSLHGCAKKSEPLEDLQQPMSPEDLSRLRTAAPGRGAEVIPAAPVDVELEPLPPSGPYKPSAIEIQTALRNAGYYAGQIDGKLGPMSKKAIEDFQRDNGLTADGKVGPKTWSVLGPFLNAAQPAGAQ